MKSITKRKGYQGIRKNRYWDTKKIGIGKEEWNSCEEIFIYKDSSSPIDFFLMRSKLDANEMLETDCFNSLVLSKIRS